jgi:hypothetical protein
MATINNTNLSLLDYAKRKDPNGAIANVVEMLSQSNAILQDAVFKEGNLETGHTFTSRTGLPSVGWRRYNEGVAASKSKTDQVTETCGMAEGNSIVDVKLANIGGNAPAFRTSEDMGFVQSFNKEMETGMFYHSTKTAPEKFMGLSPRLDSTSNTGGSQIIKADSGASGSDQTSAWLVCWGDESVFGIFPKGSKAGLDHHDMGEQLWKDANNNPYRAYVTNWSWQIGLCVKDWRQLVRIANIDTGNLVATTDTVITSFVKAYHQIQNPKLGRLVYYCNRTVGTYLHLQALNNTKNSTLTIEQIGGQPVLMFMGIPVRTSDALLNTEAVIS